MSASRCNCGAGKPRRALFDVNRVFCCFVCDACEDRKVRQFRPEVFDSPYTPDEPLDDD